MRIAAAPVELHAAQRPDPARIGEAAREFEGLFAQMLIKSMRDASFGDPLFPGENQLYRDLYDQQLAKSLTEGPGLGLAAVIARQLGAAAEPAPGLDPRLPGAGAGRSAAAGAVAQDRGVGTGAATRPGSGPGTGAAAGRSPMDAFVERLLARAGPAAGPAARVPPAPPPAGAPASAPAVRGGPHSPEDFVASVWPHAQRAARQLGVDARALVAQAALETGWGRRMIQRGDGSSANNLFGIKAGGWSGERAAATTHEYRGGVRTSERAEFRAYASPAESFADYVRLLKRNPRYRQALEAGGDIRRFAQALQRAGYATDPGYANKITAIANGPTLGRALSAAAAVARHAVAPALHAKAGP